MNRRWLGVLLVAFGIMALVPAMALGAGKHKGKHHGHGHKAKAHKGHHANKHHAKRHRAKLGKLKVRPKKATAKPGAKRVYTVKLRGAGKTKARHVKICFKAPRKAIAGKHCKKVKSLKKGKKAKAKFKLKVRGKAKTGKTYKIRFKATAKRAKAKKATVRLRVKSPGAAVGGGDNGGGGGQPGTPGKPSKPKTKVTVCLHGCDFRTIQDAVDFVGSDKATDVASNTVIQIKPGTYVEGVQMIGHEFDGIEITGTGNSPGDVILEGTNAKTPSGNPAQQGIEARNVNDVTIENLWAKDYQNNGIFLHADSDGPKNCNDYLLKDLWVSANRSYGLYTFNCVGGRMTQNIGWHHGDSAWYVGQTPPQANPEWTQIDHSEAYENVLGYSGTNSKYVNLHDNEFFNNGVGVVPNTLASEDYPPNADGIIENNKIYWNNFNYFLSKSPIKTVSNGLGTVGAPYFDPPQLLNYPIGVGVALYGSTNWTVRNNDVFGNWEWGIAAFGDPFTQVDGKYIGPNNGNHITGNRMGKNGTDLNGTDLFNDGGGTGTCFSGNTAAGSPSYALGTPGDYLGIGTPQQPWPQPQLYPSCSGPAGGSGGPFGDVTVQIGILLDHVAKPEGEAWKQQCDWTVHPHDSIPNRTPVDVPMDPTKGETGCS